MKLDLMTGGTRLRPLAQRARNAAESGHSGPVVAAAGRTAYLSCAAAALAAEGS